MKISDTFCKAKISYPGHRKNCKRKSKLVFIKIENFRSSKDTATKTKWQTEWEKIFARHISGKPCICI